MKPICLLLALFVYAPVVHAQIKMATSGNVAVGTTTVESTTKLVSRYQGSSTGTRHALGGYALTGTTRIGVLGEGRSGSTNYGIYGTGRLGTTNYGVKGHAQDGNNNYGVYGSASSGSSQNWAGYFAGNVFVSGQINPSDERLKEEVRSVSGAGALASVMELQPRAYRYRTGTMYDRLNLPDGEHFGLIAQDVEKVLPQIVREIVHPAEHDDEGNEISPSFSFKGMNYTELIPLLIQALQEQQARIEALEAAVGTQ